MSYLENCFETLTNYREEVAEEAVSELAAPTAAQQVVSGAYKTAVKAPKTSKKQKKSKKSKKTATLSIKKRLNKTSDKEKTKRESDISE